MADFLEVPVARVQQFEDLVQDAGLVYLTGWRLDEIAALPVEQADMILQVLWTFHAKFSRRF